MLLFITFILLIFKMWSMNYYVKQKLFTPFYENYVNEGVCN